MSRSKSQAQTGLSITERIKACNGDPVAVLKELNKEYFVVTTGGSKHAKMRVAQEVYQNNRTLDYYPFEEFKRFFQPYSIIHHTTDSHGKPRETTEKVGAFALNSPDFRRYDGRVVFVPPASKITWDEQDDFNLWRGFAVDAKALAGIKGKVRPLKTCPSRRIPQRTYTTWDTKHTRGWQKIYKFLLNIVCRGDEEYLDYLLRWMAFTVQFPGLLPEVAVCLRGSEGTGKGTFFALLEGFFHRSHSIRLDKPGQLTGKFTGHLSGKLLIFANEAFFAGDPREMGPLKARISDDWISLEDKGETITEEPNYTHMVIASNDYWFIRAGKDARRWLVLELSDEQRQNRNYFQAVMDEYHRGGRDALFVFLTRMDLGAWTPNPVLRTEYLDIQQDLTLQPHEKWWKEMLTDVEPHEWREVWRKDSLVNRWRDYVQDQDVRRPLDKGGLTQYFVSLYGPEVNVKRRIERGGAPEPAYVFPPLEVARRAFPSLSAPPSPKVLYITKRKHPPERPER